MNKMTIEEIQKQIIEEFDNYADWNDIESDNSKYSHLIEIGKALAPMDEKLIIDNNLIEGCQSKVWLHAKIENGKVVFFADSNSDITKGIISLLVRVFSNQTPDDIITAKTDFIDIMGLKDHLSATRANGLVSMLKQMKLYAIAFKAKGMQ